MSTQTRPRLIILDSTAVNGTLENLAHRVARSTRSPRQARVVMPYKFGNPYGMGNGSDERAAKWKAAYNQALRALEDGQDVIIASDFSDDDNPDTDWAYELARKAGAKLQGYRVMNHIGASEPEDMNPNHIWPLRVFTTTDDGGARARALGAEIGRIHPRSGHLDDNKQPVTADLHVIEANNPTRRAVLTEYMAKTLGGLVIDVDQRMDKLRNSEKFSKWSESPHKENTINSALWEDIETDALLAMRKGQPVILATADIDAHKPTREVSAMLRRLVEGRLTQSRIVMGNERTRREGDGFEILHWPDAPSLEQGAEQLARHLAGGNEPSLDDLLDLPPADRRRALPPRRNPRRRKAALPRP